MLHPLGTRFGCPECHREPACQVHTQPRAWQQLETMQFTTMLHAAVPRVNCPEQGGRQAQVPRLTSRENLTDKQKRRFDLASSRQLLTGKAWVFRKLLGKRRDHSTAASETAWFHDWYRRVVHTTLTPLMHVARTIRGRLPNVVSDCTHGITNAAAEGINTRFQSVQRRVGGSRNSGNCRTAICHCCGGPELNPHQDVSDLF